MLNIRTDRLADWLLYLAVLLGVIGTTAHAEATQLGALRQEIVAAAERSLAEMQCAVLQDLEQRLPVKQRALIVDAESRVDDSARDTRPAIVMGRLSVTSDARDARKRLRTMSAMRDAGVQNEPYSLSAISHRGSQRPQKYTTATRVDPRMPLKISIESLLSAVRNRHQV